MDSATVRVVPSPSANVALPGVATSAIAGSDSVVPAFLQHGLVVSFVAFTLMAAQAREVTQFHPRDNGNIETFGTGGAIGTPQELKTVLDANLRGLVNSFEETAVRAVRVAAVNEAHLRLEQFAYLSPKWAGENTVLPSSDTRAIARSVIDQLPSHIGLPHVSPGAHGAIGLEWETSKAYLVAEIQSDGTFVWIERQNGKMTAGDEEIWSGAIPAQLILGLSNAYV